MTTLYVNGCSYTANLPIPKEHRYPSLLATHLGWNLADNSWPGSSNDRIIRCAYKDCIKLKNNSNDKLFALIQLTHLFRLELPDVDVRNNDWLDIDDPFTSIKPTDGYDWIFKIHTTETLLLRLIPNIIGLTSFFKQNSIDYLIYFGASEVIPTTIKNNMLYQYLAGDSNILDLENFSMLDSILNTPNTHPDVDDMKKIADYFTKKLYEQV
jgi:hypothetical protein